MEATYVSSSQFYISGNETDEFVVDRRVKADCGVDGMFYATITGSEYSNPNTNVYIDEGTLTSNLTDVKYGIVKPGYSGSLPDHSHDSSEGSGGYITSVSGITDHDDHGHLTGLTDDDHPNYTLLAGRSTSETLHIGGLSLGETSVGGSSGFYWNMVTGGQAFFRYHEDYTGFHMYSDGYILFQTAANFQPHASIAPNGYMAVGYLGSVKNPDAKLHVYGAAGTTTTSKLLIENKTGTSFYHSSLELFKSRTSQSVNETIGKIIFSGLDDGNSSQEYSTIVCTMPHLTDGEESGMLSTNVYMDGIEISFIKLTGYNEALNEGLIHFNADEQNVDFRISASGITDALTVDGSTGAVDVSGDITISGSLNVGYSDMGAFDSEANRLVVGNGETYEGITIYGTTLGSLYFADEISGDGVDTGRIRYNHSSNWMTFGIRGVDQMRLKDNYFGDAMLEVGTTKGDYAHDDADNLVLGGQGNVGIDIRSLGTTSTGTLAFDNSSLTNEYKGAIVYSHTDDEMSFYTSGIEQVTIDSDGNLQNNGSITLTENGSNIELTHDGTNPYFRTTTGDFSFKTDQGTNTTTRVRIMGKGSGYGTIRIYDEDDAEYLEMGAYSGDGFVYIHGASEGDLSLQGPADANITMFKGATTGLTSELLIYGHKTTDSLRSLQIGVGVDANDTASFDGLTNYRFIGDGTDYIELSHDGDDAYFKTSGGDFKFVTDEAVDINGDLTISGSLIIGAPSMDGGYQFGVVSSDSVAVKFVGDADGIFDGSSVKLENGDVDCSLICYSPNYSIPIFASSASITTSLDASNINISSPADDIPVLFIVNGTNKTSVTSSGTWVHDDLTVEGTSNFSDVVLTSSGGYQFKLEVDDSGSLFTTAV